MNKFEIVFINSCGSLNTRVYFYFTKAYKMKSFLFQIRVVFFSMQI